MNDIHNIRKSNAPPLIRGKPFIGLEARSSKLEVLRGKVKSEKSKVKSQKETTLNFELSTLNLMSRGWLLLYYSLESLDCRRGYFACNVNGAAQIVMKTSVAHCAHPANIEVADQLTETGEQKCTGHCRAIQLELNKGKSPVLHRFKPFAGDKCFSSAVGSSVFSWQNVILSRPVLIVILGEPVPTGTSGVEGCFRNELLTEMLK